MVDSSANSDAGKGTARHGARSLLPLVYDELRAAAGRLMADERRAHTLQPTALVHEAYAKLAKAGCAFESELHFFHAAAQAMRRILLDHALARGRQKRGGGGVGGGGGGGAARGYGARGARRRSSGRPR